MRTTFQGYVRGYNWVAGYPPGLNVGAPTGSAGVVAQTADLLQYAAFFVQTPMIAVRLGVWVWTAGGDAGNRLRVGLYRDDGNGAPFSLMADAGLIAAGSGDGTGLREVTLGICLTPGVYWMACVTQSVTTTAPSLLATTTNTVPQLGNTSPGSAVNTAWTQAGVSGALPALAGTLALATGAPRMYVRGNG